MDEMTSKEKRSWSCWGWRASLVCWRRMLLCSIFSRNRWTWLRPWTRQWSTAAWIIFSRWVTSYVIYRHRSVITLYILLILFNKNPKQKIKRYFHHPPIYSEKMAHKCPFHDYFRLDLFQLYRNILFILYRYLLIKIQAVFGILVFQERLPLNWWLGAVSILFGVFLITNANKTTEDKNKKTKWSSNLSTEYCQVLKCASWHLINRHILYCFYIIFLEVCIEDEYSPPPAKPNPLGPKFFPWQDLQKACPSDLYQFSNEIVFHRTSKTHRAQRGWYCLTSSCSLGCCLQISIIWKKKYVPRETHFMPITTGTGRLLGKKDTLSTAGTLWCTTERHGYWFYDR